MNSGFMAAFAVLLVVNSLKTMPPDLERFLVLGNCPCLGVMSKMQSKATDVSIEDVTFLLKRSNRKRSKSSKATKDWNGVELVKCGRTGTCQQEDKQGSRTDVVEVKHINQEVRTKPQMESEKERIELDDLSQGKDTKAIEEKRAESEKEREKEESAKKVKEIVSRLTDDQGMSEKMKDAEKIQLSDVSFSGVSKKQGTASKKKTPKESEKVSKAEGNKGKKQ